MQIGAGSASRFTMTSANRPRLGAGARAEFIVRSAMHLPKFWKLAKKGEVSAWGWSDVSAADAVAAGLKRVDRIIAWLKANQPTPLSDYGYPNRPMREEVVREFRNSNGELVAAVSRNSYGCLVLNTTRLLFVDIDEPAPGPGAFFKKLFGRSESFELSTTAAIETWIATHPGWGLRAYRTRAGIRLVATHQPVAPDDRLCHEAFSAFGADRLYQKLCANQKCYRARLTPKPWRCGLDKPRFRWPWDGEDEESSFKAWEEKYQKVAADFAVCRLLGQFGRDAVHPELSELVLFHDHAVRLETNLPLA